MRLPKPDNYVVSTNLEDALSLINSFTGDKTCMNKEPRTENIGYRPGLGARMVFFFQWSLASVYLLGTSLKPALQPQPANLSSEFRGNHIKMGPEPLHTLPTSRRRCLLSAHPSPPRERPGSP